MEIYTFFMFYKPGLFFINALSLTNTLYSRMKNKLSLDFSDTKKNVERTGVLSILAATFTGHFSGIFRIHSSSISAYSWRLKANTLFSESNKPFVVYSLSIFYSSSTGERAEYITEDEKDQFDIVMQTSSNTQ